MTNTIEHLIWEVIDSLLIPTSTGTAPLDPETFETIELTDQDIEDWFEHVDDALPPTGTD